MAAIAAFSYETQVNAAAFILAAIAAGLAAFWPRTMITVTFGITAGMLVVMPLALPELIANLPEGVRDALPLSWIWRLEIWSYAGELIRENPWFGYGLDASRPLNRELLLQGFNVEALPMHPHNATLHIWLETGAVGAVLLASALVAMGGRIAAAPKLSRLQAIGVVWVFVVYVSLIVFSYGVWQEWHQGTVALAATSVFFLGAKRPA
nr:O-antigen ligase family protein [Maricaulis parjimensis]